jgi:orotidine-5'-phosphate decarboxylase
MAAKPDMPSWALDAGERIIVALDVSTEADALSISRELRGAVGAFKIGLQLFSAAGPRLVQHLVGDGHKIFLDLKFHDIPNTVAMASEEAAKMGVWMFNVHASGGTEMMREVVDRVGNVCEHDGLDRPLIIGVTVLTSSNEETLSEAGITESVDEQITRLARMASKSGLDGVVASSREVSLIRRTIQNKKFLTVTPGIRASGATLDDQKRVTTFRQALSNGSDYVVIGRPITQSRDRLAAIKQLCDEIIP